MLKKLSVVFVTCIIFVVILVIAYSGNDMDNSSIDNYLISLKYNNCCDKYETSLSKSRKYNNISFEEAHDNAGLTSGDIAGFSASYQKVQTTIGLQNFSVDNSNKDFIYPGAFINISPLNSSTPLSPLNELKRSPITVSPSLADSSLSINQIIVNDFTSESIISKLKDIPENKLFDNGQFPFTLSTEIIEVKSPEDLNVALGISAKQNLNSKLLDDFDFKNKSNKTFALMVIRQIFYKVQVEFPSSGNPSEFFEAQNINDIKKIVKEEMIPTYVSSVSYGRTLGITIKSDEDLISIKNKIKIELTSSAGNTNVTADLIINENLLNTTLNYYQFGVAINDSTSTIERKYSYQVQDILNTKFDINKIMPTSFTLAHMGDGSAAKVGMKYTNYTKELMPESVNLIYFNLEKTNYIRTLATIGANNIELNATKNPASSTLFPIVYRIKNAQYNSDSTSILKDENNNIIARITKEYQDSGNSYKYFLSISSDPKNINKVFKIIASAESLSTELEVTIAKVSVNRIEWSKDIPEDVKPGQRINLLTTIYPTNASLPATNYQITVGKEYGEISNGALLIKNSAPQNAKIEVVANSDGISSAPLSFTVFSETKSDIEAIKIIPSRSNLLNLVPGDSVSFQVVLDSKYESQEYQLKIYNKPSYVTLNNNVLTVNSFDGLATTNNIYVVARIGELESNKINISLKSNIYYISSIAGLKNISKHPNDNYLLLNNLDFKNEVNWQPIKHFSGTFDGNGYTISNLTIKGLSKDIKNNLGLFAENSGIIRNLIIKNFSYKFDYTENIKLNIGFLVGLNSGLIENINVDGDIEIIGNNPNIGGIVGKNFYYGNIKNSKSKVNIKASGNIGGICGENEAGAIEDCNYFDAIIGANIISDNETYGGIVGNLIRGGIIKNSVVENIQITITTKEENLVEELAPFIGIIIGKIESSEAYDNELLDSKIVLDNLSNNIDDKNIGKGSNLSYGNSSGSIINKKTA